jgi:hypothetical protein
MLDAILKMAEQLDPAEQDILIQRLQSGKQYRVIPASDEDEESLVRQLKLMRMNLNPTREDLLAEVEIVRRLPVKATDRLMGIGADASHPLISVADLQADLQAFSSEWEQELDEFYADKP